MRFGAGLGFFLAQVAVALFAGAAVASPEHAADSNTATSCAGSVYLDANGNGARDANEPGVPDARISDGERIVATDADGRYRFSAAPSRHSFLIKPAGFRLAMRADGLPDSWLEAGVCRDFGLRPDPVSAAAPLRVLVFGDPQPKSQVDLGYYERDIVAPLRGANRATLGISLGDLVNDDVSLYPGLKSVDATLGLPWLHAPGNHDLDAKAADDEHSLESFHRAFGPDTYAWEEAQANFIVFDDVVYQPGQSPSYVGGLREQQFAFLQAYLATASKERLLVLAMHIPLFDVPAGVATFRHADRDRLFALLQPFPNVLVLSAHTHNQQHVFHGADSGWHGARPLHEYNVGAACGAFWSGARDAEGIPAATMSDGTPNGYAVLTIDQHVPSLRWFAARAPADQQMSLHAPKVLRRGSFPAFAVYANVFMGDAETRVEYRIDQGEWKPMRRVAQPDPDLIAENARDDAAEALRGYDRSPEASPSSHLWRGALATDLAPGRHAISVRAAIDGFGEAVSQTSYRLDEATP